MANKPPAFQFYAKDWRSSPTVSSMSMEEIGIYVSLMALAWDSEEPGTITLKTKDICREIGIYSATFRKFLRKFPTTFRKVGGNLIQPKLQLQWAKYQEISAKRSASAQQMHMQKGGSAFASASAPASANQSQSQKPPANPASVPKMRSESEQRRIVQARDTRIWKEEEVRKELAIGRGPECVSEFRDVLVALGKAKAL